MDNKYQYFTIEGYEVIVQYGTLEYTRKGRISYEENLSDGNPVFHNAGYSKVFEVSCDILIPITKDTDDLFNLIDNKVYYNEYLNIESNFGKIFPSGKYYLDEFKPKYLNKDYYECSLNLTNVTNGVTITEFKGATNKLTTNNALLSDKKSVNNKIKNQVNVKNQVNKKGQYALNTAKKKIKEMNFKTIGKGSTDSATIKKIQKALKRNGYYIKVGSSTLKVDGIYGDYTKQAVQKFQKANGLKVTGKVDLNTAKKLNI